MTTATAAILSMTTSRRSLELASIAEAMVSGLREATRSQGVADLTDFITGMAFAGLEIETATGGDLVQMVSLFGARHHQTFSRRERAGLRAELRRPSRTPSPIPREEQIMTAGLAIPDVIRKVAQEQGLTAHETLEVFSMMLMAAAASVPASSPIPQDGAQAAAFLADRISEAR
jgi:hypothetical protein